MIEAVILYSTNDYRFFKICIDNLLKCGIKCHIITYSHMWNGDDEDLNLLNKSYDLYKNNNNVKFHKIEWNSNSSPWYWEAMGRNLGTNHVSENCDYILYIDIDEIVESDKFIDWLNTKEYQKYDSLKLSNYWYFREPIYQSTTFEDSIVLCKASIAKRISAIRGGRENYLVGKYIRYVNSHNPLIHHFSWVRTKDEMLKKVKNWGHNNDTDWVSRVNEEFSREFNGTDFLHKYSYKIVENKFNI